ncbi:MAG: hypothetical protein RIB32_04180 [Phycisphaerales bacterium]
MSDPKTKFLERSDVTATTAHRLLDLARSVSKSPIDRLIFVLKDSDKMGDPSELLRQFDLDDPAHDLVAGHANLDDLIELKNRAKARLTVSKEESDEAASALGYFMAVAAAAVHHGRFLSSRPAGEVIGVLERLAGILPAPYAELASRAARVLGTTSENA